VKASAQIMVSFLAGDDIRSAFEEAIRIAKILNVRVMFKFNGVECFTNPHSDIERGLTQFEKAHNTRGNLKMAFA
jgi:hypothetical protein